MAYLWDTDSGQEVRRFAHRSGVTCVALSPDGRLAATGSGFPKIVGGQRVLEDCRGHVWDVAGGKELLSLPECQDSLLTIRFTDDGRRVLFADQHQGGSTDLDKKTSDVFGWQTKKVTAVAFTADGKRALVAADQGKMFLMEIPSQQVVRSLAGHTTPVRAVALTPDGTRALSVAGIDPIPDSPWPDSAIRVWDLSSGTEIARFEGHTNVIHSMALSSDGRHALAGGLDQATRFLDLSGLPPPGPRLK
jgi:WD40 repeat protein